jgi:hypothetical protein
MDYDRALIAAADGKAVLFMGAGFSMGATSLNDLNFPTGTALATQLCTDANVPPTTDLKIASSRYLKAASREDLIRTLKHTFTAKTISDSHKAIAATPWKAIYTTNYDDVLEKGATAGGKKLTPLTLTDHPQHYRNSNEYVIHINGYIDRLNESTLLTEFKLTNTSYLTTQFRESDWVELFIRHIQSAQAVFFVGYSLYDLDIQEILAADKALKGKTFFIQRESMSAEEIKYSELLDFGAIVPIGVDQFSQDLKKIDPLALSTDRSLILVGMTEMKVPEVKIKPSAQDVFELLLQGKVNNSLLTEQIFSKTNNEYVFDRDAQQFPKKTDADWRNYAVIGDLGNGKTTLLRGICAELMMQGYRCFWVSDESYDCFDEIEAVISQKEPVALVFDNYTRKLDLIAHANLKRKENTVLMLSARTLLHKTHLEDLYFKKIRVDLSKTCEIDCNKLSHCELENLAEYLGKYALWTERAADPMPKKLQYLRKQCSSELHGVLLGLLSSPEIRGRFASFFDDLKRSKQQTKTVVAVFVLNLLNITQPTAHMIAAVTNDSTVFNANFKMDSTIKQFFNTDRDVITPKSSALAEFCLTNFPDPILLVDSLIEISRATRKKAENSKFYWDTYRDMASFSNVKRMLPEIGRRELLIRFYEGLRTIPLERDNPLFWLQYAMARMNAPEKGDLDQAATYLKTALAIARSRRYFTTVDIETQYARLYIEHALHTAESADEAYNYFVKANVLLSKITKAEIYKTEPYRPMHNYSNLFKKFGDTFSNMQCAGFYAAFVPIIENIKHLPPRVADEPVILTARRILTDIIRQVEGRIF